MGILSSIFANLLFICVIYMADGLLKQHGKRTVNIGRARFFILHYSQSTEKVISCKSRRIYSVDLKNRNSVSLLSLFLQTVCFCCSVIIIVCDIVCIKTNSVNNVYLGTNLGLSVLILSVIYVLVALALFITIIILESLDIKRARQETLGYLSQLPVVNEVKFDEFIQNCIEEAKPFSIECDGQTFEFSPYKADKWQLIDVSTKRILNIDNLNKIFENIAIDDITLKQRWHEFKIIT